MASAISNPLPYIPMCSVEVPCHVSCLTSPTFSPPPFSAPPSLFAVMSQETIRQDVDERKPGENVDSSQWKDTIIYERREGEYFPGTRVSSQLFREKKVISGILSVSPSIRCLTLPFPPLSLSLLSPSPSLCPPLLTPSLPPLPLSVGGD